MIYEANDKWLKCHADNRAQIYQLKINSLVISFDDIIH